MCKFYGFQRGYSTGDGLTGLTPCSVDQDVSGERTASSFAVDGINGHVDVEV